MTQMDYFSRKVAGKRALERSVLVMLEGELTNENDDSQKLSLGLGKFKYEHPGRNDFHTIFDYIHLALLRVAMTLPKGMSLIGIGCLLASPIFAQLF